ncbi:PAS domain-containing sensor histidine kinase [Halorussus aquaticus]|uniref:histidine kinase n=1 Tax=Halorussus aquaticus TaxID=2953748 RepID=A0ABD5Q8H0_9EURY|nr:PAS domain-containing sensor histidine kinase [Halorussus aquaticus]
MSSGRTSSEDVLAAANRVGVAGEPFTASEIAEELGCAQRIAVNKLEELAEQGDIESKEIGAQNRIWWRPADRVESSENRESLETELEEVFGRISDAFYALDTDWQFTYVSDHAEELIDYQDEGLVGKDFWEVFEWAEDSILGEEYRKAMETQKVTSFEFYYPDPLDAWYKVHTYPSQTGLSVYFQDISDQKRRERALEKSEHRYRTLVENFPNGAVTLVNEDLQYQTIGGKPITNGATIENLEGKSVREAVPETLADELVPRYEAAFEGESSSFETESDGRIYQIQILPVHDDDGEVFAALGMSQDITEQKQNQQQLAESERRYRTLAEYFPNGIVTLFDHDLRYTLAAGRGFESIPVKPSDLEGKQFDEVWDDETAEGLRPAFEAALDGEQRAVELEYVGREWVVHAVPITDERGKVFAGMTMAQDITERKERERELQRYREYTDKVLNAIDDVFYLLDESGTLQRWNDTLCKVTGYQSDEVESMQALEFFDQEAQTEIAGAIRDGFKTGDVHFEAEIVTKGRDRIPYEFVASALEGPDGERVLAGIGRDITDQKEREQTLQDAKEQLEAATEAGAVGTWEWNLVNDEFVTGASFARTFGVDPEDAREGVSVDRLLSSIHEDDRERVEQAIENVIESCGEYEEEYRVWNADDELRWVVARGHVECDEDGNPIRFPGALTDITDRKRTEQELAAQRKQLEILFEVLPVGVIVANGTGDIIEANEAAKDIWGVEEFDAETVSEYQQYRAWWADTGERINSEEWTLARVLRGEEVEDPDVYEIETADGERRTIMAHGMPIRGTDGTVSRGVVTLTDITERRESQRQLEESERRYRTLAENFPNGAVGLFDEDLKYTAVGGQLLDEVRITPEERIGKSVYEIYPNELISEVEQYFHATLDGETNSFETQYHGLHLFNHTLPVRNADGDVFAGMVVVQDVTDQREMEQELRKSEAKFRTLAENLEEVVWMSDPETREFLYVNPAFEEIWGRDRETLYEEPRSFLDGVHPEDRDRVQDVYESMPETESDIEYRIVRPDGDVRWLHVQSGHVRDDDGDTIRIVGIAEDVTDRVEREQQLEETVEQLEESNERLESFASMLAHELRNPVTIGQIYSQQLPAETDAEAVEYVTEAFDRIEDMVDVMLILTRGRDAVGEQTTIQLADVAREAWGKVNTPDARVEVDIDYTIQADETYIEHLFRNLFENAVEHGGPDVTITVGELSDGFYVADDGVGIPADERDTVFEAGYTTAAEQGGTGLGLAFIQKVADVYEWDYTVTESSDGGARFEFTNITTSR